MDKILLATALRYAEQSHAEHERVLGHRDEDWATWYANYLINNFEKALCKCESV